MPVLPTGGIEYWPRNGQCPFVVRIGTLSFAYPTREAAEAKMAGLLDSFRRDWTAEQLADIGAA